MPTPIEARLLQYFQDAAAVTPNDTVALARPATAIYVGTAGAVVLKTIGGTQITFLAVPVGMLNVSATQILATNTTAGGIIALSTSIA